MFLCTATLHFTTTTPDGQPYRTYGLVTYESSALTAEQAALDLGLMVTGIFDDQHLTDLHIEKLELEQGARARG
jgi:hypothetical protein